MEIHQQAALWKDLFDLHSIKHDLDTFSLPADLPSDMMWIFIPSTLDTNGVCEIFKKTVRLHGIIPFFAPVDTRTQRYQLADMISQNERGTDGESYGHTVRSHFLRENGLRVHQEDMDQNMTVVEAMLYHIFNIHCFGKGYFDTLTGHFCRGTRGGMQGGGNSFAFMRWDLNDIKVCLDWTN